MRISFGSSKPAFLLQWSRLQSEAVISRARIMGEMIARASMEPPPIGGGNEQVRAMPDDLL